jgi:hypothetical protein
MYSQVFHEISFPQVLPPKPGMHPVSHTFHKPHHLMLTDLIARMVLIELVTRNVNALAAE